MSRLLPSRTLAVEFSDGPPEATRRLAAELAKPDPIPMPRWKVRGTASESGVDLWYSLRPRPTQLAPRLFARWKTQGAGAQLVGEIAQEPRSARIVMWTGVALAIVLALLAARGGLSFGGAVVGAALLIGYPWIAWFIHGHHVEKIETFVRDQAQARS